MRCWTPLLLAAVLGFSEAQGTAPVRLAIGEWPPYTSGTDAKGKLAEAIVTAAFKLEGIQVSYSYFPWKRSLVMVENGEFDGTFPWNRTPERASRFIINEIPIIKDEGVYFHLKSNPFTWNVIDDLRTFHVGVTIGFKQEKTYADHGIHAEAVSSEEQNFLKLLAGRIDVYETSKIAGYYLISKNFRPEDAQQFTHDSKVVETNVYHILFSKRIHNGKWLADRFDAGLRKLMKSGEYNRILAQYQLSP